LKIEFDDKPDVEIINRNIKGNVISNVIISLIFVSSFGLVQYIEEPYKYLLISPSFYNYEYLTWVSSAWIGFLSIHGTIAALSITFMGMFVGQASSFSEYGFESLAKAHLLRKYNFLEFSIQSVCNLLCGIFLMLVGCGLIAYFVSAFMSLYFIIQYALMYYRLYNLNENPSLISGLLIEAIRETGNRYNFIDESRGKLSSAFESYCKKYEFFSASQSLHYWDETSIALDVFPESKNIIVIGFDAEVFERIAESLLSFDLGERPTICFYFSFFSPASNFSIKIIPPSNYSLTKDYCLDIQDKLKKGIVIDEVPYIYEHFNQFEDALINNIRNSLLNGDEWSLDFGVKAFYELTSSVNYIKTLRGLDLSIGLSNKKDIINPSLLASFLEKMVNEALARKDILKSISIMRSFFGLARYIFSKNSYSDFYKLAIRQIEIKVKYRAEESDFAFLDLYTSIVIDNLVNGDYIAFENDTKFVTRSIRYLDLQNNNDRESLNETQRKYLKFLFEVITLLIVRAEHLIKGKQYNKDEFEIIKKSLKAWINARFLEDLYYKSESYELLLSIPDEYSAFRPEVRLREIPEDEVSWHSISNDTYKMIALFLTQAPSNSNRFNLIFLKNINKIKDSGLMTTHNLESILSYLESEDFDSLLTILNNQLNETVTNNKNSVSQRIKLIKSELNSLIIRDVISAELNEDLVEEYRRKLKDSFTNEFELIVSKNYILPVASESLDFRMFKFLINKREVIPPVDRTSYGMSVSNISSNLIYKWVRTALDFLKDSDCHLKEIDNIEELGAKKLISITYMTGDDTNTYKHTRGLKMFDEVGHLQLGEPGVYFVDLNESFVIEQSVDLIEVEIKKVDDQNLGEVSEFMAGNNDNPYLYSVLNVKINASAVPRDKVSIYFLSLEKCRMNNERLEREVGQLFQSSRGNASDGSIS